MSPNFVSATFPLAYFITFRTYGTWHHGDERGSVDRRNFNRYGTPKIPSSSDLVREEKFLQKFDSFLLDEQQRAIVEQAIKDVCVHRTYDLFAVNARSNHVHSVVKAQAAPEKVAEAFKSYSTRALRNAKLIDSEGRVWSRHASTRYLWKESSITAAVEYVLYDQGDDFPDFEELVG